MIVDHLNTSLTGGAGNAARQLHRSLLGTGITSRLWYEKAFETITNVANCQPLVYPTTGHVLIRMSLALSAACRRLWMKWELKRNVPRRTMFTIARLARPTPSNHPALDGDILHLHWISRLVDIPSFFDTLPNDSPVVWTLHDMNPMTGGCHCTGGCEAFVSGCGNCPKLLAPSPDDLSRRTFRDKHRALWGKNLHIVTPSHWLAERARRSLLLSSARSLQTIHSGIDVDVFFPQDKLAARAKLGVPENCFVIAFGADYFGAGSLHKGFHKLVEALSLIDSKLDLICLAFGHGTAPEKYGGRVEIRAIGYIGDPHQLATVYSAADIFVLPSLEDNLPTTGLEAMACGTSVVAFETGGIPEFVRHGETGCLAQTGDAAELARQITWMIEHPADRERMGQTARRVILRDFHHVRQAHKYLQLYRSLLDARRSSTTISRAA